MLYLSLCTLGLIFSSTYGLSLTVTPAVLEIGITQKLEVNCSTTVNTGSTMVSLISLIISRSSTNQSSFTELASINVFTSDNQVMLDVSDVTASGKIDNNGLSYIKLNWEFPDSNISGIYRCEANGVDRAGHPVNLNKLQLLSFVEPDINSLVRQVQYLTSYIENVYARLELNNFNLTAQINEININLRNLKSTKSLHRKRLETMKYLLFNESSIFEDHYYLLSSKLWTTTPETAAAICSLFGGYLVEIDTSSEFQFVQQFMTVNASYYIILTGGTDEAVEGQWVNRYSGSAVGYLEWASGEPNNGILAYCLYLWGDYNWQMADDMCYKLHKIHNIGYMCEVPAGNL
ncbi:uncharacterized protein LOC131958018 [Physella acuta]|uniref:uncharacterized protein LOC131958018 n=1 Tax=Physella acuta TaxID=109671 RepID=UPI0027DE9946|nr:uncharacterized protein LOC131958018 [Physella acuta]